LMQQRSLQQVRVSVSLIFLIHGLIIATWASRIPAFQAHLHLSPAVLGRSLMMAAIGSVLAMPAAGWLINKFGSLSIVIGSTLGFGLALPLIAESNTVLTLSVALLFYGAMAGSMDVAMNTHAVMLEKRYQRHIMSSFHALFSLGGMAGSALGGLVASRAVPAGIHFWVSGIALAAMSILAFRWLPLPSAPEDAEKVASGGTITWSVPLGALALLAFSIMLVEGAIADWSAIYLRTSVLTGPGLAALGYAVFSGAMAGGRLTGDYLTGKLGRGHLVCYGALLAAAGLVFVLLFGNAGWALVGFTCAGAGLATIIPNTFAAAGNIEGSAPGPSLAVVTTAGYVGFLAGPPLIGFVAQLSTIRAALWILVVLSGLSAFASTSMKRTSPLRRVVSLVPGTERVPRFIMALSEDITQRKRAEEALQRSEGYLAEAQRLTHTGSWAWNVRTDVLFWSREIFSIYDYEYHEMGPTWPQFLERIHPEDRPQIEQSAKMEASGKEWLDSENDFRIILPDGTIKHLHSVAHPVRDDSGEVTEVVGTVMDVTEQWKARTELEKAFQEIEQRTEAARRSESELRDVVDTVPAHVWSTSPEGHVNFVNDRWLQFTGLTLDQACGWKWEAVLHPDDRTRVVADWHTALKNGRAMESEARVRRADGEYCWWFFRNVPLRDETGKLVRWYGTAVDIEDRKRAEQALRKSEERWRSVFENSAVGVALTDMTGRFLAANHVYQTMVGYTEEELRALQFLDVTHEDYREANWALITELVEGKRRQFQIEKKYRRKDGSLIWVSNNVSLVPGTERVVLRQNSMRTENSAIPTATAVLSRLSLHPLTPRICPGDPER
jgi:PAS domain S-box-containing protein